MTDIFLKNSFFPTVLTVTLAPNWAYDVIAVGAGHVYEEG